MADETKQPDKDEKDPKPLPFGGGSGEPPEPPKKPPSPDTE